jgi:predicted transposase YdaD
MAMSKPFDATMRELFELEPAAWLEFLGIPVPDPSLVTVIDSNVSTVTAEADKAIRLGGDEPLIVHTEVLSGRDLAYPEQALWYNVLLRRRHKVPVWTVMVLLRPAADGPELTGEFEGSFPGRGRNLWFRYDVVRVWEQPPERLLTAGLPLLPLAPVSDVPPERLPEVLTAVAQRLRDEAAPELTKTLWTSTAILMGLRYPREQVGEMIEGVANMVLGIRGIEDSWVYQDIFAKGGLEEDRKILLSLGRDKFGPPDERVEAHIAAIADQARLHRLLHGLLRVSSWDELLASAES